MCNVPPKFYQVCRLCLSCPSLASNTTNSDKTIVKNSDDNSNNQCTTVNRSIFDKDDPDYKWQKRNIPFKIMTCLSILVCESDPLPHVICSRCERTLDTLHGFRQAAHRAQDLLKQFLANVAAQAHSLKEELPNVRTNNYSDISEMLPPLSPTAFINTSIPSSTEVADDLKPPVSPSHDNDNITSISCHSTIVKSSDSPPLPTDLSSTASLPYISRNQSQLCNNFNNVSIQYSEHGQSESPKPAPLTITPISNIKQERNSDDDDDNDNNDKEDYKSSLPQQTVIVSTPLALHTDTGVDLSKPAEKLTCMPEINLSTLKKESMDCLSDYSNSSDPERLEVDMSRVKNEEDSDSTESSPSSPINNNNDQTHRRVIDNSSSELWRALAASDKISSNNANSPVASSISPPENLGEAGQLLRRLIACRSLGMTITPAEPNYNHHSFNQRLNMNGNSLRSKSDDDTSTLNLSLKRETKGSSARRKQFFPTKTSSDDRFHHTTSFNNPSLSPPNQDMDSESDYPNVWCNIRFTKDNQPNSNATGEMYQVHNNTTNELLNSTSRRIDLSCNNCGVITSTVWRRNMRNDDFGACSTCGDKLQPVDMVVNNTNMNTTEAANARRVDLSCSNCGTMTTTIWRRNMRGEMVCNACGLYFKLHGVDRPHAMRRDTIHTRRRRPKNSGGSSKRQRLSNNGGNNVGSGGNNSNNKVTAQKSPDTDQMLAALRRHIQPHLMLSLQSEPSRNTSNLPVQNYSHLLQLNKSSQSVKEMDEDDNSTSASDLPLNLVSVTTAEPSH